jgi:23S rRNA pseudouridine2605 synthase
MSENPTTETSQARDGQRIAKVIARAGLCSRRDAEAWITEGRVSVNGKVLESPAYNVGDEDDVRVDGERLRAPERTRLFFFHKPRGLVTTARDPEGRPTIFEALPPDLPRVVAIGRLDINTEGLLLLTNDGGLARVLELPATGWLRRYRVRAHGEIQQAQLDALREGVTIEGIHYAGIEARLEREQGSNVWIMMGLREGKNREIKRVLEHLGMSVNRLIRVSFGPFELGDLPEGAVAELNTRILRDQLGLKLAKQAGANFDAPIETRRAPAAPPPEPEREERRPSPVRPSRPPPAPRGDRPPIRARVDRSAVAAELASRGERKETLNPRKRKHVSILRAEARAEAAGPRKRVERSATADRRGREVKIERISTAREPAPEPARAPRGKRKGERPRAPAAREPGAKFARSGPKREVGARNGGERAARPFRAAPAAGERDAPKREFSGKRDGQRSFPPKRDDAAPREARPARSGPRREYPGARDAAPAREGRSFRAAAKSADGEASAKRAAPTREHSGGRAGGKPGGAGRPPSRAGGKPPGKRPPRKS